MQTAKADITAHATRGTSFAILGENYGREALVIKNSVVHAKAMSAAIAKFRGGISIQNGNVVFPRFGSNRNGSIYATSSSDEYAKEVRISNFFITQQPESRVDGPVGEYVSFRVATSIRPTNYQWQRYNREKSRWENVYYTGATSNRLSVRVTEDMYFWRFRCVMTYGEETLTTDDVNLRVVARITSQPVSQVYVDSGSAFSLKVTAEGSVVNYTWQYYNQSTGNR